MLYILTGDIEQCSAEKKPIHTICPHIWIHYVLDGAGYYENERLEKGQGFIVYKGDSCSYRPDTQTPWKYFWIRIWGEDSENILEQCGFPTSSGAFSFSYSSELEAIYSGLFGNDTNRLDIMCGSNLPFSEALCKLILSMQKQDSKPSDVSAPERWARRAKEYIRANYHKPITVEEISDALHIDRKYLRNIFVKCCGISTKEYLIRLRVERAKELLCATDESVNMIASSVGYDDALGFSKIFKKTVGVSPKKYRQERRTK